MAEQIAEMDTSAEGISFQDFVNELCIRKECTQTEEKAINQYGIVTRRGKRREKGAKWQVLKKRSAAAPAADRAVDGIALHRLDSRVGGCSRRTSSLLLAPRAEQDQHPLLHSCLLVVVI